MSQALKERHYAQVAGKLNTLAKTLLSTETEFTILKDQVEALETLAALHAAQFMSVSRLVDIENENAKTPQGSPKTNAK